MSLKKKILVFTATYNELENIHELISSIKNQSLDPHLLIIDDNSPDGTSDAIEKAQLNYENIFLIKRKSKLGLDTAHKEAYDFAITNNYDYLIKMSLHLFTEEEISNLEEKINKLDKEFNELKKLTIEEIWLSELDKLLDYLD